MNFDNEEFKRWLSQAEYNLSSAENDLKGNFHSWCCFKCQQAAELALKALIAGIGEVGMGHSNLRLLEQLSELDLDTKEIESNCRFLDKYYIPTRYPDAYPQGKPADFYSSEDAKSAIKNAKKVITFVKSVANGLKKD